MATTTTPPIPSPRTRTSRSSFELYAWLFMRMSGILLVVLVLGHLLVNLVLGSGIQAVDFAFVAGKWTNPFWQVWDLLMLWLAELHGVNGLRTIINDYTERAGSRFWLKALLYLSALIVLVLGTLVIFTFDPCLDPSSTLSVCK
jgi:succinate dehydrogenase / fumarate reductase membrane anchor subunit